jgi:hypothetical protein
MQRKSNVDEADYWVWLQIFDHAYGVLCLRTLTLILQVGLIAYVNPIILEVLNEKGDSHRLITSGIGDIMERMVAFSRQDRRTDFQDLGWYRISEQSNCLACLPSIGGLSASDVTFLLEKISADSWPTQRVVRSSSVYGFTTLLFLSWQHLLHTNG